MCKECGFCEVCIVFWRVSWLFHYASITGFCIFAAIFTRTKIVMMKKTFFFLSVAAAMTFSFCGERAEESNAVVNSLAAEKPDCLMQPDEEAGIAARRDEVKEGAAKINTSLLGVWDDSAESGMTYASIIMELSDNLYEYMGKECYGTLMTLNVDENFEREYVLVFKFIAPDGDNIKVHYEKLVGEIGDEVAGEGDLIIVALGNNKARLDCREPLLKNKLLYFLGIS